MAAYGHTASSALVVLEREFRVQDRIYTARPVRPTLNEEQEVSEQIVHFYDSNFSKHFEEYKTSRICPTASLFHGDAAKVLVKELPDESIDFCG